MNKERLEMLAKHLEKLPPEKFDMISLCGTACCIAGHVRLMARLDLDQGILEPAAKWLGLDYDDVGRQLFVPAADLDAAWEATPQQAAAVVRHLKDTGKVEWERFVS